VSILAWVVFGALAGWAANLIVGGRYRQRQGCLFSILVGIAGSALGGLLYKLVMGQQKLFEFDLASFGVAVVGAVVLLALVRLAQGWSRRPRGDRRPHDHW
jgi:uncharacterized membrane protein YeaQ/YmgE (transglycosylase-associated protein family)